MALAAKSDAATMLLPKRHCCCCVQLSDGVLLVGIYGAAVHLGLLLIQMTHGHSLTASVIIDPRADSVVHPLLLVVHVIGVIVNTLLVVGVLLYVTSLMLPWMLAQGMLSLFLSGLAIYYLTLYPHIDCHSVTNWHDADCPVLLLHSVVMILSLLLLYYYCVVVWEFSWQVRWQRRKDVTRPLDIIVEPLDISDQLKPSSTAPHSFTPRSQDSSGSASSVKKPPAKLPAEAVVSEEPPTPQKKRVRIQEPAESTFSDSSAHRAKDERRAT